MKEGTALLEEATQVWAKAQVVYEAPSWEGEPPARAFAEQVAMVQACHDGLVPLLPSPDQLVVAHALQALELMRSPVLAELSEELCDRRQCGSFRNSMVRLGLSSEAVGVGVVHARLL